MKIYLIGVGSGPDTLTTEAERTIRQAECLIGAERLLDMFPDTGTRIKATRAEEIRDILKEEEQRGRQSPVCVLFSGDTGFYSGTKRLLTVLDGYDICVLPGISSLQLFAARLGRSWQDWQLCSAHGKECDAVKQVCCGKPVFFLTGGKTGPDALCRQLTEAGLGTLEVTVGQDLGTEEEKIISGTAGDFSQRSFSSLSVLLAEAAPRRKRMTPGFPDSAFQRVDAVPMTKQFVRAAILAKLAPAQEETCWDIGSGTGSVAIELAMQAGRVYAVEKNPDAVRLAEVNRKEWGAWNLTVREGNAPEALGDLPVPDAVFIGGSGRKLKEIVWLIHEKNEHARICMTAIAVESLADAIEALKQIGYDPEIVQIGVSQSKKAGSLHLMTARNPVWLIAGGCA